MSRVACGAPPPLAIRRRWPLRAALAIIGAPRYGVTGLPYLTLLFAIVCEVVATTALKAADGFRVPGPTALVLGGYVAAFYLLSLTLRTIPVGIAYAIWSGVGQVLVLLFAWRLYGQTLDPPALLGIALILAGVLVLALFSSSMPH